MDNFGNENENRPKLLSQICTEYVARHLVDILWTYGKKKRNTHIFIPPTIADRIFNMLVTYIEEDDSYIKWEDCMKLFLEAKWDVLHLVLNSIKITLPHIRQIISQNNLISLDLNFAGFHGWHSESIKFNEIVEGCKSNLQYLMLRNFPISNIQTDDFLLIAEDNFPNLKVLNLSNSLCAWMCYVDKTHPPKLSALILESFAMKPDWIARLDKIFASPQKDSDISNTKRSRLQLLRKLFFKQRRMRSNEQGDSALDFKDLKDPDDRNTYALLKGTSVDNEMSTSLLSKYSIFCMKDTLTMLMLYGTTLSQDDLNSIFELKNLKNLDLSWPFYDTDNKQSSRPENMDFFEIVSQLPKLKSLDISGTCQGDALFQNGTMLKEITNERKVKLPKDWKRPPLEYLGLWKTDAVYLKELDTISEKVWSGKNEEALLLAIERNIERCKEVCKMWIEMYEMQRSVNLENPTEALELVSRTMQSHFHLKNVMMACTANLSMFVHHYYHSYSVQQRQLIARHVVKSMEKHVRDPLIQKNCLQTLYKFNIPYDFVFIYEKLMYALLNTFKSNEHHRDVVILAIHFMNQMVCCEGLDVKKIIQSIPFVTTMINLIKSTISGLQNHNEVLQVAWSILWNVTDESEPNSSTFIKNKGHYLFLRSYEMYKTNPAVMRNMMGLMGNIAEVSSLRSQICGEAYLQLFRNLLEFEEEGVEVAYNACGILSHILVDDNLSLGEETRTLTQTSMQSAILSWDIDVDRSINYRSLTPILKLLKPGMDPAAQLWAIWALSNLTRKNEKYPKLIIKENGVSSIESLIHDTSCENTRKLAESLFENCKSAQNDIEMLEV